MTSPAAAIPIPPPPAPPRVAPSFIVLMGDDDHDQAMRELVVWVKHLLMPIYGREVTSGAPWCSRWWEHLEAVAQLHALWMAWDDLVLNRPAPTGPADWHRDYLIPVMAALRDPSGPFAGCKTGRHQDKGTPDVDDYPDE
jgi:hypothetical protein